MGLLLLGFSRVVGVSCVFVVAVVSVVVVVVPSSHQSVEDDEKC